MDGRCGSHRLPPGLLSNPVALGTTTDRAIAPPAPGTGTAARLPARVLFVFPVVAATVGAAAGRDHSTAGLPSLNDPCPSCWDLRQAPAAVRGSCMLILEIC